MAVIVDVTKNKAYREYFVCAYFSRFVCTNEHVSALLSLPIITSSPISARKGAVNYDKDTSL